MIVNPADIKQLILENKQHLSTSRGQWLLLISIANQCQPNREPNLKAYNDLLNDIVRLMKEVKYEVDNQDNIQITEE